MTPIEVLLQRVEWQPTGAAQGSGDLPYATHQGVLQIGDISLRCYRLNDGLALIDADDMLRCCDALIGD